MKVPARILDGGLGDWERRVVESAASDAPSAEFRRRMAKRIGMLATVAAVAGATPASAQTLGALTLIKLFGVGAAVGLVTISISRAVGDEPILGWGSLISEGGGRSVPSEGKRRGIAGPDATSQGLETAIPPVTAPASPGVPTRSSQPGNRGSSESPPAVGSTAVDSKLSEELRAIERVRGALVAGDAREALRELDRYESSPRAGLFRIEAEVLRIEVLTRLGEHAAARTLAERFLANHAESPYVRRVRTLVGDAP